VVARVLWLVSRVLWVIARLCSEQMLVCCDAVARVFYLWGSQHVAVASVVHL